MGAGGGGGADTTPPGQVTGLSAVAATASSAQLRWDPAVDDVGVAGYRVYRDGTLVGTTGPTQTSLVDAGLAPATTYAWTVVAYDAAGNVSPASAPAGLTTPATVPDTVKPSAPTSLAAVVSGPDVALTWKASTDDVGVTGYTVYRNGVAIGDTSVSPGSPGTSLTTTPPQGVSLTFSVRARDAAGNTSNLSNYATLKVPDQTAPTAPVAATATPGSRRITLAWGAAADNVAVTAYDVYRGTTRLTRLAATARSYAVTGLTTGTRYTHTLYAVDAAGNRSPGVVLTATAG